MQLGPGRRGGKPLLSLCGAQKLSSDACTLFVGPQKDSVKVSEQLDMFTPPVESDDIQIHRAFPGIYVYSRKLGLYKS